MIQTRKAVIRKSIPTIFLVATVIALMIASNGFSVTEASNMDATIVNFG